MKDCQLLEREFSNYRNVPLKFEFSKGVGNFPTILHTSILPPGQKTSNGIYVVICFDKFGRGALVGAAKSKTTPQTLETIDRKLHNRELKIDVDGDRPTTKYNDTFANPKEFYYELKDDTELKRHIRNSLDLVLFKLGLVDTAYLEVHEQIIAERDQVEFNPEDMQDARKKIARQINLRMGQQKFRKDLIDAYNGQCAVTGTSILEILDAAHIVPYKGKETNHIQNGILLRTDIHTLFDLQLMHIDPVNYTVIMDLQLRDSDYWQFNGKKIKLPSQESKRPSPKALVMRLDHLKNHD